MRINVCLLSACEAAGLLAETFTMACRYRMEDLKAEIGVPQLMLSRFKSVTSLIMGHLLLAWVRMKEMMYEST